MIDPQVHDQPADPVEVTGENQAGAPVRPQGGRSEPPRASHRSGPLFPEHTIPVVPPRARVRIRSRIRPLALEAVTERRNQIPLGLIILLAITFVVLMTRARPEPPPPQVDEFLPRLVVSSSQPGTSLFGNGQYLGEIGPAGRQFTVAPGLVRLRVIHRDCTASDTTVEFKAGELRTIGPLNAVCGGR